MASIKRTILHSKNEGEKNGGKNAEDDEEYGKQKIYFSKKRKSKI